MCRSTIGNKGALLSAVKDRINMQTAEPKGIGLMARAPLRSDLVGSGYSLVSLDPLGP